MPRQPKKGRTPRNKFEAKIAGQLDELGVQYKYEGERLKWLPPPPTEKTYTPDFILTLPSGKKLYIESKGLFSYDDRVKMLCVIEQHPDKDLRMVFYNAKNKINKGSPTSYGDWCSARGICWADKTIPLDWLTEEDTPSSD